MSLSIVAQSICSISECAGKVPSVLEALQRGSIAAQTFIKEAIGLFCEIEDLGEHRFLDLFAQLSQASSQIEIASIIQECISTANDIVEDIVDFLEILSRQLPEHLRPDFWEYCRTLLKDQLLAFLQQCPEQYRQAIMQSVDKRIDNFIDLAILARV